MESVTPEDVERVLVEDALVPCSHCNRVESFASTSWTRSSWPAKSADGVYDPRATYYCKVTLCPRCLGLEWVISDEMYDIRERMGLLTLPRRPPYMLDEAYAIVTGHWRHLRKFAVAALETTKSETFVLTIALTIAKLRSEDGILKIALVGVSKLLLPKSESAKWPPAERLLWV